MVVSQAAVAFAPIPRKSIVTGPSVIGRASVIQLVLMLGDYYDVWGHTFKV